MSARDRIAAIAAIAGLFVPGCRVQDESVPAPEPPAAESSRAGDPPTAPLALRAWLEQRRFRESWELWPGTGPFHAGAEGHAALHTTWVSPPALDALEAGLPALPPGAVVILDEHTADSLLLAVDVMVRSQGTEAGSADWHFARFGSAGEIEPAAACAECHVREPDWLFSGEIGTSLPVDSTGAESAAGGMPDSL